MDRHASSPTLSSPNPHNNAVPERPSPTSGTDGLHEAPQQSSSQSSLPESTPASERHPKGKRKRTAAKDKSILEAAYTSNPKPDKTARLELVKRVSLTEKEVQIWFQNRRQNDRRKSRPLSPQEIAALRYGGMQILSSDPLPYNSTGTHDTSDASPFQVISFTEPESTSPAASETGPANSSDEVEGNIGPARGTVLGNSPTQSNEPSPCEAEPSDDSLHLSRSFPSSLGYLSNRWNPGSSFSTPSTLGHRAGDDSIKLEPFPPATCSPRMSAGSLLPPPNSQPSQVRISLSLEGKAEVIAAITSPQRLPPPRPTQASISSIPPIRRPSLQRSHSVQPVVTLPPISALTGSLPGSGPRALPPRLTRGRSRDVHAWEFCCDADNQEDALTAQAKHESSGSAIAVISLLRSTSSAGSTGGALQPSSSSKRNAPVGKASARPGIAKKPRLSRSSSSIAKLQTTLVSEKSMSTAGAEKESDDVDGKSKIAVLGSPAGSDSDKENWSPDEEGNPQHRPLHRSRHQAPGGGRRPLPSGAAAPQLPKSRRTLGRPLQEHRGPPRLSANRANTAPVPGRRAGKGRHSPLEIFEDKDKDSPAPEVPDLEVERFMRGEVSPSKKPDVDAVAGLLSLSQGNWR